MTSPQHSLLGDSDEDGDRVATPTAASHRGSPLVEHNTVASSTPAPAPEDDSDDIRAFSASIASILDNSLHLTDPGATNSSEPHSTAAAHSTNGHIVLPLPASSSRAQSSYILPDPRIEEAVVDLPPDIATADISIARES